MWYTQTHETTHLRAPIERRRMPADRSWFAFVRRLCNASQHSSRLVRTWIREHNQQVKQDGCGVRILPLFLPKQNPWLNPIEPKWVHGKRAVVETDGLLSAQQLAERICAYFGCSCEPH